MTSIDGTPSLMGAFNAEGPGQAPPAMAPIQSQLFFGAQFATTETAASEKLVTFVESANAGLDQYVTVARSSAQDYFNADEAGKGHIMNVSR